MGQLQETITQVQRLHVRQVLEAFELIGFETRNKYQILDDQERPIAYAAEEKTGLGGNLLRHFLGHWRSFRVILFDHGRDAQYILNFPFRWFFKTLYISDYNGRRIGHLEQRFAIFRKKFDLFDSNGQLVARINSSFFRFWTFEFYRENKKLATIQKKWSGALGEFFTDKDNFLVSFADPNLSVDTKVLMLSTCVMVDIVYFENNKGSSALQLFD